MFYNNVFVKRYLTKVFDPEIVTKVFEGITRFDCRDNFITLVCEVLKVKHEIANSMIVYFAKSKNFTHFLQSGQVFEMQGCNGIVCSPL